MRGKRVLALALGILTISAAAFLLNRHGPSASWLPGCLFHRMTGLSCPGCGMTRAAYAVLHGDLGGAFRLNPVGMVLFPAALLGLGLELAGWARGKPLPFRFRVGGRWAWGVLGIVLAFWVVRNIPEWPFTLLSPP